MRYIGNILTSGLNNYSKLFNVVSERKNLIKGIPTLVIGWEFTVSEYVEEKVHGLLDITDWKIDEDTYWTFSKREKSYQMTSDLDKFTKMAIKRLSGQVSYSFFNIMTEPREKKSMFWQKIKSMDKITCFLFRGMLYLWADKSEKIVGISLRDIEYCGGNPKKTLAMLHSLDSAEFVRVDEDADNEIKNIIWGTPYLGAYLLGN